MPHITYLCAYANLYYWGYAAYTILYSLRYWWSFELFQLWERLYLSVYTTYYMHLVHALIPYYNSAVRHSFMRTVYIAYD
ncbi:hypothetical protein GDO78_005631 [Eleutherodactylus coqui]|uniref:Uncharacterized protein n=1 Tax=Eleutherodactylus coqui TaxID=57060 RepID=A0A8J6FL25_ELECQ|nr:hypothetical protein GDO78_005631 [Eleutherodactylus coqui]